MSGGITGIVMMVRRSLRQHFLSTFVTAFSVALATGLVLAVLVINSQSLSAFRGGQKGFDAVLGARGSELQLVLNTIYHLETSPGNIPWSLYQTIKKDRRIALAIPYAVGDSYKGYRIVGTSDEVFTTFEFEKGRKFDMYPGGRAFNPDRREAVIGDVVARRTGLRVGSKFNPTHGVVQSKDAHSHADEYVIVGITKPTNSPSDRVIWIPIDGIYRMEGHVLRGGGETTQTASQPFTATPGEAIPDEYKEVSAVMIKFRDPAMGMQVAQMVNNQGKVATMAYPIAKSVAELFDKMGWVNRVLELVAYLVVVVAVASILASLYNTINERRREFAILRALGARRVTVFSAIIAESAAITTIGVIAGYLICGIILYFAAMIVREKTGVVIDIFSPDAIFWKVPLAVIALGALSGVLPAIRAYSTDVASNLSPSS
jgi:putative ABC transport system permease protein